MITKINKVISAASLLLVGIGVAILFFYFIPSGDDWGHMAEDVHSVTSALKNMKKDWVHINGRVLGNLSAKLFTFLPWRYILKLLMIVLLSVGFVKLVKDSSGTAPLLLIAGILMLPMDIFREVWVWNAGFYNYIPPLTLLLWLYVGFYRKPGKYIWQREITMGLLAGSACLFMENITIFVFALSLFSLYQCTQKNKGTFYASWGMTVGAWIGTGIMFLSPAYQKVISGTDNYRSIGGGYESILEQLAKNWPIFKEYLIALQVFLYLPTVALFLYLLFTRKGGRSTRKLIALGIIQILLIVQIQNSGIETNFLAMIMIFLAYYGSLIVQGILMLEGRNRHLHTFSILTIVISMGPLLFLSPVGARNFFLPVPFHLISIFLLFKAICFPKKNTVRVPVIALLVLVIMVQFVALIPIYAANHEVFLAQRIVAEQAVQKKEESCLLPSFPYPEAIHHAEDLYKMGSIYFREKPGDIVFRLQANE